VSINNGRLRGGGGRGVAGPGGATADVDSLARRWKMLQWMLPVRRRCSLCDVDGWVLPVSAVPKWAAHTGGMSSRSRWRPAGARSGQRDRHFVRRRHQHREVVG
jgi:hypothetical protein